MKYKYKILFLLSHPWLSADNDVPVIISAGRLNAIKNFPLLIEAFKLVRGKRNARLIILGEGEEREKLEEMIQDLGLDQDVDMPGFAENPFNYIAKANVYALTSFSESFSMALIEALAVGTPVVSNDCPHGPREVLENGRLVPLGNSEKLAEAILNTLDEPIKPVDLNDIKHFTIDSAVDSYINLTKKDKKSNCDM